MLYDFERYKKRKDQIGIGKAKVILDEMDLNIGLFYYFHANTKIDEPDFYSRVDAFMAELIDALANPSPQNAEELMGRYIELDREFQERAGFSFHDIPIQ